MYMMTVENHVQETKTVAQHRRDGGFVSVPPVMIAVWSSFFLSSLSTRDRRWRRQDDELTDDEIEDMETS